MTALKIIDGRHRFKAAVANGIKELRCDVHHPDGRVALRVIPTDQLEPDPDVQLPHTFNERHARKLTQNFDLTKVGVLVVCTDDMPVPRKAALKLSYDRDRRSVSALEHFQEQVLQEDADALSIQRIVNEAGYRIGSGARKDALTIDAVVTLSRLHDQLGDEGLRRTMRLVSIWLGDPATNTGFWLSAMGLLVRDDFDAPMLNGKLKDVQALVPAVVLRQAKGRALSPTGGSHATASGAVAYEIASMIRRRARLRKRPANPRSNKAANAKEIS